MNRAPPTFVEDPRAGLKTISALPIVGGLALGVSVLGAIVWWTVSAGSSEPRVDYRDRSNELPPAAMPLAGLPTDYSQLPEFQAQTAPGPTQNVPAQISRPDPTPATPPVTPQYGAPQGRNRKQEALEADIKSITVNQTAPMIAEADGINHTRGRLYSKNGLTKPYRRQLNAGTLIAAELEQPITTDSPGIVTAWVRKDYWDAAKQCVVVPMGTRFNGVVNGNAREGVNKIQVVWTSLTRPLPRNDSIEFEKVMQGGDPDGTAGIGGQINEHWGRKLLFIGASSILDIGRALVSTRNGTGNTVVVGDAITNNTTSVLDEAARRQLDIPPTVESAPKEVSIP